MRWASRSRSCSPRSITIRSKRSGAWTSSSPRPRRRTMKRANCCASSTSPSRPKQKRRPRKRRLENLSHGETEFREQERASQEARRETAAKRAKLKAIANDTSVDETERLIARLKLAELPRNGNPTRVRNRCELTGRSRAYYRKFRLSRIMLRELANKGLIPGVIKSSW